MSRKHVAIVIALLMCTSAAALGDIVYVDDDAPAGGDGRQWATAFTYLRDALTAATDGTEIRIAQGTYLPDRSAANPGGTASRSDRFQINTGRIVRGGYAGLGAPDPDARDIELYETVLSGDLAGNDQPGFVGMDDNSYKVVYLYYGAPGTLLEGVTIRSGSASRTSVPFDLRGGGLYVLGGSPTISKCTFTANWAGKSGSPEGNGAGMYIVTGTPYVRHCRFYQNKALGNGGGCYVSQVGPEISDCVFEENAAGNGGGLTSFAGSTRALRCEFTANTATQNGGGVYVSGGSATLSDCLLQDNSTPNQGGGLNARGTVTVNNCQFINNSAAYGSGAYNGGAAASNVTLTMNNCLLDNNPGAALANWPGTGTVTATLNNCTLVRNGAGVIDYSGVLPSTVTSCIVWANGDGTEGYQLSSAGPAVDYSCVQGWSGTYGGTGNFGDDPMFVDLSGGDWHLATGSPCVDAGDPSAAFPGAGTDLDGQLRVWDGDGDELARIDAGADEFASHGVGDLNCDGAIDFGDINPFVLRIVDMDAYFAQFPNCPDVLADINGNGHVGFDDINAFVDLLLGK